MYNRGQLAMLLPLSALQRPKLGAVETLLPAALLNTEGAWGSYLSSVVLKPNSRCSAELLSVTIRLHRFPSASLS